MSGVLHLLFNRQSAGHCAEVLGKDDSVVLFGAAIVLARNPSAPNLLLKDQSVPIYVLADDWRAAYGGCDQPKFVTAIDHAGLVELTERYRLIQSWKA